MTDEIAVSVTNLVKKYKNVEVLNGISLQVYKGEVFGLIGPNGAGKTTTLRAISGILKKYEGDISIFGYTPEEAKKLGYISYMPEDAFPYEKLSGIENLEVFAQIYARGDKELEKEFLELGVKIADLGNKIYEQTSIYSRGMKRRLMIARALMVKPRLAILDEPTTGLDVESTVRVRRIIRELPRSINTTILFSSHNMLEVDFMCDRIALINKGKIVEIGMPKQIAEKYNSKNLEEAFLKAIGNDKSIS
ncbi:ABC transporter ATP-binding protein [Sulfolobus acidocaldarius]|uniref:ABC transporter, ATP binding n=4 Tax=Sulfolobus acidocaldarius TaxID=2285 RepID=Q4JA72_SULAC|nr:ABC transporter ATP-binding protein [Sulfolobus acidocaldarius]AAY80308.1 ABC transporter, ATP binding [Sulfolobus acidocaldarius DSM 639]AGE70889.1 ABC transporter, ATP binding protein [Sulfolobus acidocaldarius N8]AGE73160.1 ABC transporter, ATP binding protein [Sulfolobus acidocaldarius Ron12/I]ALU28803.1 multidrug ABC transporter ATP-binding protein [Sulfolobus acidocaldarius]ALU31523.1 multidrug ABC transporter ATP-binding protein [Sulfolobus acidocaldarius]